MWAKIEVVPDDQKIIYLPATLAKDSGTATAIIFGGKSTGASIQYRDDLEFTNRKFF